MRPSSLAAVAALSALASAGSRAIDIGDEVSGDAYARAAFAPKRAPTYSATPAAPIGKKARRAKDKATKKARSAQRMRAKGKR